ncbi:hypothetical protein ACA910_012796 [Epithemia clementina (nom. ined.)]
MLYTGFAFAGRSIWIQSVLSAFVYFLKNNMEAVGYITAVMGLSQLLCSFPAAFVADSYRRDFMLKISAVVGVAAVVATLYAMHTLDYLHLVFALIIWGCCWGIANTSLAALFADSVPTGQRSHYFTQRATLVTLGFSAGPVVSLVMFAALGDEWNIRDCAVVMSVGQIVCFPSLVLLCFFSDDDTVHHGNAEGQSIDGLLAEETNVSDEEAEDCQYNNTLLVTPNDSTRETGLSLDAEDGSRNRGCCGISENRKIAVLVATADVIGGLAAGMSIRYFPIFFVDHLRLGPVKVQVLYILSPLLNAFLMKIAQKLANVYGRCHISAYFKWVGVILMYLVIVSSQMGSPKWIICSLYVFRSAFINSTGALTKSVLMDNVPKKERAKWAALESLNMFSWSGSAALGGVVVGIIGIMPLFAATATMQLIGTIPLIFLWAKDTEPGQEENQHTFSSTTTSEERENNEDSDT